MIVDSDAGLARVRHGLWEFDIPLRDSASPLTAFAERKSDCKALLAEGTWTGFARLLDSIGALAFSPDALTSTRGLHSVHSSLLVEWYAEHYSSPFWKTLSLGNASLGQLHEWVARTYFLSRSVGASASKGALHSLDKKCREIFLKNALEEYDHCHVFYGTRGPIELNSADLAQPAISAAIDTHFISMGEFDQWGHALSALYQERTAMFARDAAQSYDAIKATYKLEGTFDGWKQHLGVDYNEDHAGDFASIFENDRRLDRQESVVALIHAWTSAMLLKSSIDQLDTPHKHSSSPFRASTPYVLGRLHFIVLKAMSNAHQEQDIVPFGDMLVAIQSATTEKPANSNWKVNLHTVLALNDLQKSANDPGIFASMISQMLSSPLFEDVRAAICNNLCKRTLDAISHLSTPLHFPIEDMEITTHKLLGW